MTSLAKFPAAVHRGWRRTATPVVVIVLTLAACGSDAPEASTSAAIVEAPTSTPAASPTPVVVPTSPPEPTPTPLPTSTPVPLEEPTPSSVLLTTAFTNSSRVTTVGIDEVFFGMTPDEAAEAASTEWVGEASPSSNCYRVTPANGPDRLELWVVDGHIERLDIEHPDIRTRSRLGVGNTLAELKSQLGDRLSVESTGDGGQTATFTPSDTGDNEFRMVFELLDDAVVRYRSGRAIVIDRATQTC